MLRTAPILPALLLATTVAAEGISDGSLARSAILPFAVERDPASGSVLRVVRVDEGSTAARGGLRDGDLILRIDGKTYGRPAAGRRALEHGAGGRALDLELRRGMRCGGFGSRHPSHH